MMAAGTSASSPTNPRVRIRKATSTEDLMNIRRWQDHYFGTECEPGQLMFQLAEVAGWTDEDDPDIDVLALVAEHGDVMVGCAVAVVEKYDQTIENMPEGSFNAEALAGERNGWLMLAFVDPAWRGRGIGTGLLNRRMDWLREKEPDMVFGFGWERDGASSRPLFERAGFVPVERLTEHYERTRTSCPDCGIWRGDDGTCSCEATFWALDGETLAADPLAGVDDNE